MLKDKENGFTLIALMIVIAIIGILAAIAMPQYDSYVRDAKAQVIAQDFHQTITQVLSAVAATNNGQATTLPSDFSPNTDATITVSPNVISPATLQGASYSIGSGGGYLQYATYGTVTSNPCGSSPCQMGNPNQFGSSPYQFHVAPRIRSPQMVRGFGPQVPSYGGSTQATKISVVLSITNSASSRLKTAIYRALIAEGFNNATTSGVSITITPNGTVSYT